jgi:hypothetical protein
MDKGSLWWPRDAKGLGSGVEDGGGADEWLPTVKEWS